MTRRRWAWLVLALVLVLGAVLASWPRPPAASSARSRQGYTKDEIRERLRLRAERPVPPPREAEAPPTADSRDTAALEPGVGRVVFEVEGGAGAPVVRIHLSCDSGFESTRAWSEEAWTVPEGACRFHGWRMDGVLTALSPEEDLDVVAGATTTAVVRLPNERIGGVGIQIEQTPIGMGIRRVFPGGPAAQVGLDASDIIIEVDGVSTEGMDADEFIRHMTGPEGSSVSFVVARPVDTGFEEVVLETERQAIESAGQ